MTLPPFDLYLITDPAASGGLVGSIERALARGVPADRVAVQLRAKDLSEAELLAAGQHLRAITREAGVRLLVNGPAAIAKAISADGVQVPEGEYDLLLIRRALGEHALIGRSCHDLAGVQSCAGVADFATLSPYYAVPGKNAPLSTSMARDICERARIPIFALGGINKDTLVPAMASGAHGIAVIRAVFASQDPASALLELLASLDAARASASTQHGKRRG